MKTKSIAFKNIPSQADIKASVGNRRFRRPEGEVTVWQVAKEFIICLVLFFAVWGVIWLQIDYPHFGIAVMLSTILAGVIYLKLKK